MTPIRMKPMISAAVAAATLVSGCVSVLPKAPPPAARYAMEPVAAAAEGPAVDWRLIVENPAATRIYDTTKVAVAREGGRFEYLAGSEWADRAPRLIQSALVQSFENSGRILGVGGRSAIPLAEFVLQTDIRALQAHYDRRDPVVRAALYARFTDGKGVVYAARLFESEAPIDGRGGDALLAAFDDALQAVFADIVVWSFETGEGVSQETLH
ncbi:MAG: ABC-type transport auxiliary lipoprotein family protein [Parvularculaceae bacterium]